MSNIRGLTSISKLYWCKSIVLTEGKTTWSKVESIDQKTFKLAKVIFCYFLPELAPQISVKMNYYLQTFSTECTFALATFQGWQLTIAQQSKSVYCY